MQRTFVFGDIHGCYDEFIALINQIGISASDQIVSIGDIVDRGNKSLELYHYFKNKANAVVLMGNHERKHKNGILSYAQEIVKVQFGDEYGEFTKWLATLPYLLETEDAIILHAFFEHDQELHNQREEVLAGTTSGSRYLEKKYPEGKFWTDYYSGSKPIIYGHHVVGKEEPKIENNTYGIDTAACHGGRLTAIELPGFKIHQIEVNKDYWQAEQSKWQIPVLQAKNWESMKIVQIHKQMAKLSYKEETDVIAFFKALNHWVTNLDDLLKEIKTNLEKIGVRIMSEHAPEHKREIAKLPYSGFVFKAISNNLKLEDLENALDTPTKIIELAETLGLVVPKLNNNIT